MAKEKNLTPRTEDFSSWYNELVLRSELADYSPVRGSMVIRPWGYTIWENMQRALDDMFKATGHENAYFPLLIPISFIEKEKEHVEGFKPELAIVTNAGGKELEDPLAIRPTSETIIMAMYAKWIQSYRDLPLLLNQWSNVVRWELRTRPFLRTSEFLWQEGHTAHASSGEAEEHTKLMLNVYRTFMEDWMAMPPVTGLKSDSEKFAGAVRSYSCEAMMQDNRALQSGTSHFLGQNFSKQFQLTFQTEKGNEEYAWNTSWGVSTRLVGGLVMTHGDDQGLVLPPKLSPIQVVIVPILKGEDHGPVLEKADAIKDALTAKGIRVKIDARDFMSPGNKYYEWERKGVPFRMEIGPKDMATGQVVLAKRMLFGEDSRKEFVPETEALATMENRLDEFQAQLLEAAKRRREDNSYRGIENLDELAEIIDTSGGYVFTGWSGDPAVEDIIKEKTKATLRCIPEEEFRSEKTPTRCIGGEKDSTMEVVWARAY